MQDFNEVGKVDTVTLQISGLTKGFGKVPVLKGINLSITKGEIVGVIGPNGSGKSTLFGLIAGQLQPDSGEIHFLGRDLTGTSPAQRAVLGIGRCFQIPQAFGSLSVFENLLVAASFAGGLNSIKAEDRALSVLARTGFKGQETVLAESLPLLDRKRLELARALATGPDLLLLDEIAGGLTDDEAYALSDLILLLRDEGLTIIWIEHMMHVLTKAVDRIVVLGEGSILADGSPLETLSDPVVREIYMGLEEVEDA